MFRLTLSKQRIATCCGRSASSLARREDVCNILNSHLKLDSKAMQKISKYKIDTVIANIPKNQIIHNCTILQTMNINLDKVQFLANCLMLQPMIVRNRIGILREMCVKSVGLDHIYRFSSSMNKTLKTFKKIHGIPQKQDILPTMFLHVGLSKTDIKIKFSKTIEYAKAGEYYQICLLYYEAHHLNLHSDVYKKKRRWIYRSITETTKLVNILKTECQFDDKFLKKWPHLLRLNIDNVKEFLSIFESKQIHGRKITDMVKRRPDMLFYDTGNMQEILHLQKELAIPDEAICKCINILKMSKGRFLERYVKLANHDALALWLQHPRVGSLIYNYKRVTLRLRYLKPLNYIQKANVQTYLAPKKFFLRFIGGEVEMQVLTRDFIYILRKELGEANTHLIFSIKKHPYWKHVSLISVDRMLRYLKKHFLIEDICANIHIILYPRSKVIQVLNTLQNEYSEKTGYNLTPKQYLALCLYKLEKRYHFSGDAIWQAVHTDQQVLSPNIVEDVEDNKANDLVEYINAPNSEIMNVSGAAWLEYLLK